MTQVAQIMTRGVRTLAPTDSLVVAAQTMDELNIGAIPVCDGDELVGMITDRDITVRGVAQGRPLNDTPLGEVMSQNVRWCYEDDRVEDKLSEMRAVQIRRLPVVDRQQHLVGMLSLGDVAVKVDPVEAGEALVAISLPAEPDRPAAPGTPLTGKPSGRKGTKAGRQQEVAQ